MPIKRVLLHIFFICFVLGSNIYAQNFTLERLEDVPVSVDGTSLSYPFTGGMTMPRFNNIHLNNDGVQDLIIFESLGNKFLPFLLEKDNGLVHYTYHPEYEFIFPELQRYMMVVDFNGDGIKDIVTSQKILLGEGTFQFYKGVAPHSPGQAQSFEEQQHRALFANQEDFLKMHSYDIPTVGDINNDGDIDVLLFPKNERKIHYLENQSIELGYGKDSLIFELYDDCWGKVEYSTTEGLELDVCPAAWESNQGSCAGSYLMNYDFDKDGDKDVCYSNLYAPNLFLLNNTGDNQDAYIQTINPNFLSNLSGELPFFPGSYLLDVDDDQDLDIAIVTNDFGSVLTGSSREEFYLFTNTGNDQNPKYTFTNPNFIVENTIDEGFRSSLATIDYNGDGLLDLVLAANIDHSFYNYFSRLTLFENIGNLAKPAFVKVQEDFAQIGEYTLKAAHPAFGDLDGDGDQDLVIGINTGALIYFENTSTGQTADDFQIRTDLFDGLEVSKYARPQIIDLDRDGLQDVVVGSQRGKISFFKNTGSAAVPHFELVTDTLGHLYTNHYVIESAPYFFEPSDSSGYFLINGLYTGNLELYQNIDNNLAGPFEKVESHLANINLGTSATVHMADLNNDGVPEVILGNERGGVNLYSLNEQDFLTTSTRTPAVHSFRIFPNPARDYISIQVPISKKPATLLLYSAAGKLLSEHYLNASTAAYQINTSTLSHGLYFCTIRQSDQTFTQKFLITGKN